MKFLETMDSVYNVMSVVNALKISRRWDIILAGDEQMHHPMKEAIKNFQNDFSCVLLDADTTMLDFSEENAFVEQECSAYTLTHVMLG